MQAVVMAAERVARWNSSCPLDTEGTGCCLVETRAQVVQVQVVQVVGFEQLEGWCAWEILKYVLKVSLSLCKKNN